MDKFLTLLQFADGLFPAGAYAHSFGLESYVQSGEISSAEGVEHFLRSYLSGSVAPTDLVALLCAWRAGKQGDLGACIALDETLDAMKAATELREASRQMGRQTLRVANHFADHLTDYGLLTEFGAAVAADLSPCHHAIVFGMIGAAMAWPGPEMARAFLYSNSAALVGAALRLLPLGQLAGQRILWNAGALIATLAGEAQEKNQEDMWSFSPALEIAGMRHARLEARLFRS